MEENHPVPPEPIKPRNITQTISIIVGFALFVLGCAGLLYPSFAGLQLSILHSLIIATAGGTLFYNGIKDNEKHAFLCCLLFGLFFGIHSILGFLLGKPGTPALAESPDPELLRIIPNFSELGTIDHVLNGVIGVVLLGGALDWWNVQNQRRKRKEYKHRASEKKQFNKLAHR